MSRKKNPVLFSKKDRMEICERMVEANVKDSLEVTINLLLHDIMNEYDDDLAMKVYEAYLIGKAEAKGNGVILDGGILGERQKEIVKELKKMSLYALEQTARFSRLINK